MSTNFSISGKVVDVIARTVVNAKIDVVDGVISAITPVDKEQEKFLMPGFVDAHMHIESTLLIPSRFAAEVVRYGTLGLVADPHEIANVLGEIGVDFMLNDARKAPLEIRFAVPSCVPATAFETSGFVLDANIVGSLLRRDEVVGLAEVMNYVGVIQEDLDLLQKIEKCKQIGKKIDGHAPGVRGVDLKRYAAVGISTDHECSSVEEALERLSLGMMMQIREGSAAKNFDALIGLMSLHPDRLMFCTDDLHPDDMLAFGHIDALVRKALQLKYDLFDVLRAATYNPVKHYGLDLGLLQVGDSADFLQVDSLEQFHVERAYRKGVCVFENNSACFEVDNDMLLNNFSRKPINLELLKVPMQSGSLRVIVAEDGELMTRMEVCEPFVEDGCVVSDVESDVLKIVVLSRYDNTPPAIGFVKGFGLQKGALAESVAHDSHNIIAVGATDEEILRAINIVIEEKGALVAVDGEKCSVVPLEVAGLMSNKSAQELNSLYLELKEFVSGLGGCFHAPLMTLSFMSLLVIPEIKLSDKGLFNGGAFELVELFKQ